MSIEWNDQQPIYRQLRDLVVERIMDGTFPEGEAVPSVRQVAARVGVEPSYLSKVERGREAPPSEPKIRALARELNEDPDDLLAMAGKVAGDLQEVVAVGLLVGEQVVGVLDLDPSQDQRPGRSGLGRVYKQGRCL